MRLALAGTGEGAGGGYGRAGHVMGDRGLCRHGRGGVDLGRGASFGRIGRNVSQQLTNLEGAVGVTLLNRGERPVTLTRRE